MAAKHERKLLWAFTLICVVSATVFLIAFTFTPTLVSAQFPDKLCGKPDPQSGIATCEETILEKHRGPKILDECIQACKDMNGTPARFGPGSELYCANALDDVICKGVSLKIFSPDEQIAKQEAAAMENKKAAEEANKKECSGFLNVGCWINKLLNVVADIGATILDSVVRIVAGLVEGLATLLQKAMIAVINSFMEMPVSPSNDDAPKFVREAWATVRNLANNLFILILAFIGLATILRLQAYQLQKTLPALLLVALLVNFSGVLVGLVADVGNIITSYFLKQASGGDLTGGALTNIKIVPSFDVSKGAANLGLDIVRIIYYAISSLIFLGVMIAFALRTIILWTLAIVSPLAFAAYILPATRGLANGWWKQLIQWALFGIPLSFFLFLASLTLQAGNVPSGPTVGVLSSFLAPFTTLFLLFTGITMSMAMAPAGAQSIIGGVNQFGKKWGGRAALATGSAAWHQIGGRFEKLGSGLRERGEKPAVVPENAGFLRKTLSAAGKYTGTAQGTRFMARWAGRGVELGSRELTMRVGDKDEREFQQGLKEVANKDSFMVFNMVNEELAKGKFANQNRILGLLNGIRNRGDGDDIEDALFKEDAPVKLDKKVIGQAIKTGLRVGPPGFRPLLKSFMSQVMLSPEEFGFQATAIKNTETGEVERFEGKDSKFLTEQLQKLPSKFSAQDFQGDTLAPKNFDVNTEEGKFFIEKMLKERGADFMGQLARRPRKEESRKIMEYIFKEGEFTETGRGIDWLLDNNAEDVLRYLDSPGARSLGLGRGITRQELEAIIEQKTQKRTKRDLLEQKMQLEQQRDDPTTETRTRNRIITRIAGLDAILTSPDMDESPENLRREIERLQGEITTIDAIPEQTLQAGDVQSKVRAQKRIGQIQQELRRRGPERPVEEQIAEDLASIRVQLNDRTQELQNLIRDARQAGVLDFIRTNIPVWEAELADIPSRIQDVETGLRQIEGLKVPESPAPLPKILQDMPSGLRATLSRGEETRKDIEDRVGRMHQLLTNVRGAEQEINRISNEMRAAYDRIDEINNEEAAGRIDANLQREREELQSVMRRSLEAQRRFGEEMAADAQAAATMRDATLERQEELAGIRNEVTPLYEEYQGRKEDTAVEKRAEQRRKRRRS